MSDELATSAETADKQPQVVENNSVYTEVLAASGGPQLGQKKKRTKNKQRGNEPQDRRPALKFTAQASIGDDNKSINKDERKRPSDQGNKSGPRSNRLVARENMLNFTPLASHPAPPYLLSLQTEYTQRLYLDHYGRAQISLYNLVCYLPIRMRQSRIDSERSEQFLDALEDLINERISNIRQRLVVDIAEAKKLTSNNGVNAVNTYTKGRKEVSLAQLTPQIGDLLGLLPLLDQFVQNLDALWLANMVKGRIREFKINAYRNEIVTLIRFLMHLYHESARLLEKGDGADFAKLLQPVDSISLPETLAPHEEDQARSLTGANSDNAAIAA